MALSIAAILSSCARSPGRSFPNRRHSRRGGTTANVSPFISGPLREEVAQPPGHRTYFAVSNHATIDLGYARQLAHRARAKHVIGGVNVIQSQIGFAVPDSVRRAEFQDGRPG